MIDRELEATLVEALDALEAGAPLDAILERYPQQAEQLRPLLETAAALSHLPVAYATDARRQSRDTFLRRAADLRDRRRPAVVPWWRRFTLALGSLAVLLLILGGLLVGPAAGALPGDALYPLKLAGEGARLALAGGPDRRDVLHERFRRERVSEINALLALSREADVACYGTLRAVENGAWLLQDLRVTITPATVIEGEPRVGAEAEGTCRVAAGQVTAVTMRVQGPDALPTVEPTATPTVEPTPAATGTPEPSPTPAPTLTNTPTPTPTETLAPPPAGDPGTGDDAPTPAGGDDDDGDDDDGDDGDDDGNDDDDDGNDDDDYDGDDDDDGNDDDGNDDDDDDGDDDGDDDD